jgi:hypothetical protein
VQYSHFSLSKWILYSSSSPFYSLLLKHPRSTTLLKLFLFFLKQRMGRNLAWRLWRLWRNFQSGTIDPTRPPQAQAVHVKDKRTRGEVLGGKFTGNEPEPDSLAALRAGPIREALVEKAGFKPTIETPLEREIKATGYKPTTDAAKITNGAK